MINFNSFKFLSLLPKRTKKNWIITVHDLERSEMGEISRCSHSVNVKYSKRTDRKCQIEATLDFYQPAGY